MNAEIGPALDEISAILKKYDMAGMIIVANKTHTDYRMEIEPSWSCAKMVLETEPDGRRRIVGVRIRSKMEDYPSREAQEEALRRTVGTFVTFGDVTRMLMENLTSLLEMVDRAGVKFFGRSTRED